MHSNIGIVYYINLEHREDRRKNIINQLNEYKFSNIERIPAIYTPNRGYVGCAYSQALALQKFIDSPYEVCIIFEDDFEFVLPYDKCLDMFSDFFKDYKMDWDIVMLSSNTQRMVPEKSYLSKIIEAQTVSGIMVHKHFAPILLELFTYCAKKLDEDGKTYEYAIDIIWKRIQPNHKWYVFEPKMGKQIESYSDIENKIVNYNC